MREHILTVREAYQTLVPETMTLDSALGAGGLAPSPSD
jgi:hypothetical protein